MRINFWGIYVIKVFGEQVMSDGFLEGMIGIVREGRAARNADEGGRVKSLEKTLGELEKRKKNLMLAVEEGAMSVSDVRGRLDELKQQIAWVSP